MIQAVVRIICLVHFFRELCVWKLEFVALIKQLEQGDNVLILQRVLLVGAHLAWSIIPSTWLRFGRRFQSPLPGYLFFLIEKIVLGCLALTSPVLAYFFSSVLTLVMVSYACSSYKTSCFQVRHSVTPIWIRSSVGRLWRQVSISIACIMPLGYQGAILWSLFTKVLMDSSFFCFVVRIVGIDTSVLSLKNHVRKSFSRSPHFLIEPAIGFMNHSKATPLRVPMNKWAKMVSFDIIFSIWDLK